MAHSLGYDYELESKIWEMSNYLDRLVLGEEKDYRFDPNCASCSGVVTNLARRTPPVPYIPNIPPPVNLLPPNYGIPITPSQYPMIRVTSALATRMHMPSSTLRFVNPAHHPRARKWGNTKPAEKEPDSSDIEIGATMAELDLTPESLTNNEVYRLFSTYSKLAFYINSDYIFENIYEARTLPNTMSASVQTRHAVWSSNKLLRQLRDSLKRHDHVPLEYQIPFAECKKSLEDLHMAILKLETYKYCILEHRKGKFVSIEARENLEPLMDALNQVIECVGQSRMYIQVIEWALSQRKPTSVVSAGDSCAGPSQPVSQADSLECSAKGRPAVARRYIG